MQLSEALQEFGKGNHIDKSIIPSCNQEYLMNFKACPVSNNIQWFPSFLKYPMIPSLLNYPMVTEFLWIYLKSAVACDIVWRSQSLLYETFACPSSVACYLLSGQEDQVAHQGNISQRFFHLNSKVVEILLLCSFKFWLNDDMNFVHAMTAGQLTTPLYSTCVYIVYFLFIHHCIFFNPQPNALHHLSINLSIHPSVPSL